MISKLTLLSWVRSLPSGSNIGIDEGGLTLRVVVGDNLTEEYYEIGGIPEEIEHDDSNPHAK